MKELLREFLTDILTEKKSQSAQEAERLGLEKKPGFGTYGPPGKDVVTHRSVDGKLQPVVVQQPTPSQKPDTSPSAQQIGTQPTSTVPPASPSQQAPSITSSTAANEVFGSLVSQPTEVAPGVSARQIIDPKTKQAVDVTKPEGCKHAVELIDDQLAKIDPQLKQNLRRIINKESTEGENVFKWLGNVGELHTLRELLQNGTSAYLLPDSAPDNDIVIVQRSGEERNVVIHEISVKSSTGDLAGGRGANARKSLHSSVSGKEMEVDKESYDARDVVDAAMANYIEFTQFFSDGFFEGRQRNISVPKEDMGKFDNELLQSAINASKSSDNKERKGAQTKFLQARKITEEDVNTFEQHISTLNLTPENQKLMAHFMQQLRADVRATPDYRATDVRKLFRNQVAHILRTTGSSLNFDQDIASVKFTESGFSSVNITPAETVRSRVLTVTDKKHIADVDIDDQMKLLNFSLRTRALGTHDPKTKQSKKGYLGPIINLSPPSRILKPEDRLSIEDYMQRIGGN